jgi:CxxC motif-containing protein (DUF1111 family)
MQSSLHLVAALSLATYVGCASRSPDSSGGAPAPSGDDGGDDGASGADRVDVPLHGVSKDLLSAFNQGDVLFELPLRESDGLGPLYTRPSCGACHEGAARGPGLVEKMVVVEADGVSTAADQSALPFGHTVHALLAAGAKTPIVPPNDPRVKVSSRVGPPVLGRGYMEAIADSEIERVAAEQSTRPDGIHGRANHVAYASEANPDTRFHAHKKGEIVLGRFGLKARVATLDDFTADALQGDMGITSPLRPDEFPNPDGLTDDLKAGIDVSAESVNARAMYLRLIAIPRRPPASDAERAIFDQAKCSACHVPSLRTRDDYPIALLAGIEAPVFSDLLLHDMGDALADGMVDGEARARDWRTAPLIGLRFNKTFMHDGRARTIEAAILAHDGRGSEAAEAVRLFGQLSAGDRAALLEYVGAL